LPKQLETLEVTGCWAVPRGPGPPAPARSPGCRQNPTSSPTSRVPVGRPDDASNEA